MKQALTFIFLLAANVCLSQAVKRENLNNTIKYDSVIIIYWETHSANEFNFRYFNSKLKITSTFSSFKKQITDTVIIKQFLNFVNDFYIEKKSKISFGVNDEPSPVSDYPCITAKVYRKNTRISNVETTLYSNIKFNPKFIEFYKFLDKLVIEK